MNPYNGVADNFILMLDNRSIYYVDEIWKSARCWDFLIFLPPYVPIYVTTPTNIWAWQQAITIALELHSCYNANIERKSQILAVFFCL